MYPGSHLIITPQTLQGVPSYADMARRVLPNSDSQGVTSANPSATTSDRPLQSRGRLPVNNSTTTVQETAPTRPRTTRDKDTSELDTAPKTQSQDGQVSPSIGVFVLVVLNSNLALQPPAVADEALGEGNTTRPQASKVDRIPSIHPSLEPSTHSTHALNQHSLSASPSSHAGAPTITETASSRTRTARNIRPRDPDSDARSGGAPSELPHAPDEVKGSGYPNEQSHTNSSASSRRPPLSSEDTTSAVRSPSLPQPVSGPRSLDRSNSRIQKNEGAGRDVRRAAEGPTPDKKERKPKTVSKEPENLQEDPATDTTRARRHKPEPNPPSSYTSGIKRSPLPSPPSSVGRTYSSIPSHRNDSGIPPPRPDTSELPGNFGHSHAIGTSPNNNPTKSSADHHSQLATVASDSEIRAAPSLSRTMSSRASAPIAPKTSREDRKEGETLPRPIPPPTSLQSDGQPSSTTVPLASQKRPTGSLRDTGDDTFSRLPDDRHHGETPTPSVVQADSPQEAVENKPGAKSSDSVGLVQSFGTSLFALIDFATCLLYYPTARTAPSMVKVPSNTKEERRTQAQSGHSISQLQHSQRESGGVVSPNEQHRPGPLTKQTETPSSGLAIATGVSSSFYVPPGMGLLVTTIPPGDLPIFAQAAGVNQTGLQHGRGRDPSPPPPYEQREAPSVISDVQEGSRPKAGVPAEIRDEPNKSSGKKCPIFCSPPLGSQASLFYQP